MLSRNKVVVPEGVAGVNNYIYIYVVYVHSLYIYISHLYYNRQTFSVHELSYDGSQNEKKEIYI